MNCGTCSRPIVGFNQQLAIDKTPDGGEIYHAHVGGGIHIFAGMKVKDGEASLSLCPVCIDEFKARKAKIDEEAKKEKK